MLYYCYLAAGNARRFGTNKLIADVHGAPLWTHGYRVLKAVQNALGGTLRVVTRTPKIAEAAGADALFSPESEGGKSFSIKRALLSLGEIRPEDKLLFLTADQPSVTEATVTALLSVPLSDTKEGEGPLAAAVCDGEHVGNPVIFSGCLLPDLLSLTGDEGGKAVLANYPARLVKVPAPAAELFDVDTPDDLKTV